MDTTIVVEAWASGVTPIDFVAALCIQALLIGTAIAAGWAMGKSK